MRTLKSSYVELCDVELMKWLSTLFDEEDEDVVGSRFQTSCQSEVSLQLHPQPTANPRLRISKLHLSLLDSFSIVFILKLDLVSNSFHPKIWPELRNLKPFPPHWTVRHLPSSCFPSQSLTKLVASSLFYISPVNGEWKLSMVPGWMSLNLRRLDSVLPLSLFTIPVEAQIRSILSIKFDKGSLKLCKKTCLQIFQNG